MGINHLDKKFSDNDTSLILSKINQGEFAMLCKLVEIRDSSCGHLLVKPGLRSGLMSEFQSRLKNNIESE